MPDSCPSQSVFNELNLNGAGDDAFCDATFEEEADAFSASVAIVECPVIDVHADEGVGFRAVQTSGKLHGMVQCAGSMI